MQEYIKFMEWLQASYPYLYMQSWKAIAVPVAGEAVTIVRDGIDDDLFHALVKAVNEYHGKDGGQFPTLAASPL